ncbi:MAG: RNA polymerase sigma factor [Thermogutta sp.]
MGIDGSNHSPVVASRLLDWGKLLREHERWLRAVIFARVREPQVVEDVLQEVALAAVEQKAPIQDPEKVSQWLYRLAVLNSLMFRRRQGRRRKWIRRYTEDRKPQVNGDHDPLGWLISCERREMVQEALNRLSSKDVEILLLKYGQDWRYEDIAQHLGITTSAVQTRLFRARQRLRDELARMSVSPRRNSECDLPI